MRLQIFVVVLLAAAAAGFVLLNPDIAGERREVQLPGARVSAPVLGATVLATVGALVVMLSLSAVVGIAHDRSERRLNGRLAQREHELALVKSAAYDRVGGAVEAVHRELSTWLETEGRRRHEELRAQIAALQRLLETRPGAVEDREVVASSLEARRDAA